jgi:ABC-type antimicrobial peptide transport system permease subunit
MKRDKGLLRSRAPLSSTIDICLQAIQALRDNRLRTILSILGITVGIAAVMTISTVSKGGKHLVFTELETFGLKSIWIFREPEEKDPRKSVRSGTGIENSDYDAIKDSHSWAVRKISPVVSVLSRSKALLVRYHGRYSSTDLTGVSSDYLTINNDSLQKGRSFRDEDIARNRPVAIIGTDVQKDLFAKDVDPIGQNIRIGDKSVTVIGLLGEKNRDFLSSIGSAGGGNANHRIILPYTYLQQLLGKNEINYLQAESTGLADTDAAVSQMKDILKHRQGERFSYKATTMAQYITTAEKILKGVSVIGIIAASVSLFVGGMGIMNIMTTSVVERTREIGIRKALGASKGDILAQFLFEAILISLLGGALGLLLGMAVGYGLAVVTKMPLTPSWPSIIIALTVSILVGLISGYYPAFRASSLKPVEALRYE